MDGTLWDSSEQVAAAWNIALKQCGYYRQPITAADMQSVMGKTMDVIARLLFPEASGEWLKSILQACCEVENDYLREHGGVLYPQVRKTLEQLKNEYPLYIVSNCQSGYIEAFFQYYRLGECFEDTECYGNNGWQKAENIRLLYERNGLSDAVYVGDTQGDFDSSRAAGVRFIHAAYGFGTIREKVPKISGFYELPERIGSVW